MDTFREYQGETLPPPRLQRPRPAAWNAGHGDLKDQFVLRLIDAVAARFAESASASTLAIIGAERGITRAANEDLESYRVRVLNAFAFWRQAGTLPGMLEALRVMGFTPTVIELRPMISARWAEFVVILRPGATAFTNLAFTTRLWADDGFWGSDSLWGFETSTLETNNIVAQINTVKAAHTRLAALHAVTSGAIWGEGGNWMDDGVWESGDSAVLYNAW